MSCWRLSQIVKGDGRVSSPQWELSPPNFRLIFPWWVPIFERRRAWPCGQEGISDGVGFDFEFIAEHKYDAAP